MSRKWKSAASWVSPREAVRYHCLVSWYMLPPAIVVAITAQVSIVLEGVAARLVVLTPVSEYFSIVPMIILSTKGRRITVFSP